MRITLVNTLSYANSLVDGERSPLLSEYYIPVGLLTVAALLEKGGHLVSIVDPNMIAVQTRSANSRAIFGHVLDRCGSSEPDIVGFTTMCDSYHHTLNMAAMIKQATKVPIVLGGPHATAVAESTLAKFDCIDFVLRGEAEVALPALIEHLEGGSPIKGVPNLSYRCDGVTRSTSAAPLVTDLDLLPVPSYGHYAFLNGVLDYLPIEIGRGCPFLCNFCSTSLFFNRTFRIKSGKRILSEIEVLERIFGSKKVFRFIHDMMTVSKKDVVEICSALRESGHNRRWSCSARADCVTDALLNSMADAGCVSVYFGIETGSQRLQREMKKKLNLARVFPRVRTARGRDMDVTLSFMCGFPEETKADLGQTLEMMLDASLEFGTAVQLQMHVLAPYVGTEVYDTYKDKLIFDGYLSDQVGQALDREDELTIRQNSDLFSNFYSVPLSKIQRSLLYGVDAFCYTLIRNFPITISVLRATLGSALAVFEGWQAIALRRSLPAEIGVVSGSFRVIKEALENLVSSVADNSQSEVEARALCDAFRYENCVASVAEGAIQSANSNPNYGDSWNVLAGVAWVRCHFDIGELRTAVWQGKRVSEIQAVDGGIQYVAVPRGFWKVDVIRVTSFVRDVLLLCNGKRDTEQILRTLTSSYKAVPQLGLKTSLDAALSAAVGMALVIPPSRKSEVVASKRRETCL